MSSIRVVARIRPPNSTTTSTGKQNHGQPPNQQSNNNKEDIILTIPSLSTPNNSNSNSNNSNSNIVSIPNPKNPQETYTFAFSSVYDSSATQQDIFDREVAPAIKPLFNGVDVTVFAYGVTGTGKTFTMVRTFSTLSLCAWEMGCCFRFVFLWLCSRVWDGRRVSFS